MQGAFSGTGHEGAENRFDGRSTRRKGIMDHPILSWARMGMFGKENQGAKRACSDREKVIRG